MKEMNQMTRLSIWILLILALLLTLLCPPSTPGQTACPAAQALISGWTLPTGSNDFCGYLRWLCYNSTFNGYHLGQDMCNSKGNPVYSIGYGEVLSSGLHSCYGLYDANGNCTSGGALIARYQAADGTWFTALYGHLDLPPFLVPRIG